ncbi:protein of unknown function [Flagellimonas taeanensis]|uniref:DUF4252 domain-containing protein n=1 Tax=Flagellimonas taeanensis TaxID=1005926 RepID=A0A1M7BSD8_9FLAO|nr:DUF4252 domain-containing protein [Allomuricauda taeanensis]MEE1962552.1 DUF4252 domain-containing protein [Allomuricauda taeanensis]SFC48944.1 protein of unknown function [Allomuricauda taeanensis]SHL57857.1 protein of unknown function [Allomuricauda taeanensis]
MKHIIKSILVGMAILLASCSSQQSLQEYYVDNSENPNFLSIDVPASILKMEGVDLTPTQKEAVESLRKFNLLAFKKNSENEAEFEMEKKKVKEILKGDHFVELMKINSKYGKGVIKYLGDEDAIDEVIIYGDSDDKGFALVRVLGKDMNPAHIMQLMQAIQKSEYKGEGLGEIGDFLKG